MLGNGTGTLIPGCVRACAEGAMAGPLLQEYRVRSPNTIPQAMSTFPSPCRGAMKQLVDCGTTGYGNTPNSSSANEGTKAYTQIAKGVEARQAGEWCLVSCC